jgi:hypothetical protein
MQSDRRTDKTVKFKRIIYLIHPNPSTAGCQLGRTMFDIAGLIIAGSDAEGVESRAPRRGF